MGETEDLAIWMERVQLQDYGCPLWTWIIKGTASLHLGCVLLWDICLMAGGDPALFVQLLGPHRGDAVRRLVAFS